MIAIADNLLGGKEAQRVCMLVFSAMLVAAVGIKNRTIPCLYFFSVEDCKTINGKHGSDLSGRIPPRIISTMPHQA